MCSRCPHPARSSCRLADGTSAGTTGTPVALAHVRAAQNAARLREADSRMTAASDQHALEVSDLVALGPLSSLLPGWVRARSLTFGRAAVAVRESRGLGLALLALSCLKCWVYPGLPPRYLLDSGSVWTGVREGWLVRGAGGGGVEGARTGEDGGTCGAVMDLLAVLSASGARRSLIYAAAREGLAGRSGPLPALAPEVTDRALARLAGVSLLTFSVDGSAVSAHRLVMRVIRETMSADGALIAVCQAAARLLDTLAESLSYSWHEDRAAIRDLVEQIMTLEESCAGCPACSDLDRRMIRLKGWAVMFLNELADSPARAIVIGERQLTDQERDLGRDHPETLTSRHHLAEATPAPSSKPANADSPMS